MLWRGVDITTFPTEQLWEWDDRVKAESRMLRAEIDRRTVEAVEGSTIHGATGPPTDPGAPPRRDEGEG